jgi:hypothetical protein
VTWSDHTLSSGTAGRAEPPARATNRFKVVRSGNRADEVVLLSQATFESVGRRSADGREMRDEKEATFVFATLQTAHPPDGSGGAGTPARSPPLWLIRVLSGKIPVRNGSMYLRHL